MYSSAVHYHVLHFGKLETCVPALRKAQLATPTCRRRLRSSSVVICVTTQCLSVPHVMCRRTEGTSTTARCCCGLFVIMAPDTKLPTYLLTCVVIQTRISLGDRSLSLNLVSGTPLQLSDSDLTVFEFRQLLICLIRTAVSGDCKAL